MEAAPIAMDSEAEVEDDNSGYAELDGNELLAKWKANRSKLPSDFSRLLDPELSEERRGDLFEMEDEYAMDQYAWAIPDERALRICSEFAPLVEIGAGAGYWARLLRDKGVHVDAFDINVGHDAKAAGVSQQPYCRVEKAGPEKLLQYPNATLLLIYPDDHEDFSNDPERVPLSVQSLQMYQGDTIIHVGEWLGSTSTLSMEGQATPDDPHPWGRSTAVEFQILLNSTFHKVLDVPLPNWGSVKNCLTVWKRTQTVVLEDDRYAYIPSEERLEVCVATPSTRHLLKE
eukprot:scaffold76329_cov59-Attheya_sp.AAC.4